MVANLNIKDVGASDHVRFLQPKKLGIYKWNINSNPHNHRCVLLYFNSDLAK